MKNLMLEKANNFTKKALKKVKDKEQTNKIESVADEVLEKNPANAFLKVKENIDLVNIDKEYVSLCLEVMQLYSEFFASHPNIHLDVDEIFNRCLYGENGVQIIASSDEVKRHGAGSFYDYKKNVICLPLRDEANNLWAKMAFAHEFTHFIWHNAYAKLKQKSFYSWLDEAMTEKVAIKISSKAKSVLKGVQTSSRRFEKSYFSSGYFGVMEIVKFINRYFKNENEADFLTYETFFNGEIYDKLEEHHIDYCVSQYISAVQDSDYFNFKLGFSARKGRLEEDFVANFIRAKFFYDEELKPMSAKDIASIEEIFDCYQNMPIVYDKKLNKRYDAVLNLAVLNSIAVREHGGYITKKLFLCFDEELLRDVEFIIKNYSNNIYLTKNQKMIKKLEDATDRVNQALQEVHKKYQKELVEFYNPKGHKDFVKYSSMKCQLTSMYIWHKDLAFLVEVLLNEKQNCKQIIGVQLDGVLCECKDKKQVLDILTSLKDGQHAIIQALDKENFAVPLFELVRNNDQLTIIIKADYDTFVGLGLKKEIDKYATQKDGFTQKYEGASQDEFDETVQDIIRCFASQNNSDASSLQDNDISSSLQGRGL